MLCRPTADTYDSRSDRSDHIYHEIGVENHSSANSGQEPDFLIRRAAKKVTFIPDLRINMRACVGLHVCILPIHTIHAVTVLTTFITKSGSKRKHSSANSGQEPDFLIRRAAKKVTFIADLRTKYYACMRRPRGTRGKMTSGAS